MTSKQLSVQKQRRCDTFIRPNVEDSHEKLKSINQILLNTRRNMNKQTLLAVRNSDLEIVFDKDTSVQNSSLGFVDCCEKLKSINQILLNTRRNMNHQSLRVQNSGLEIVFDDCHEKLKRINQTLLAIQKNN